MLEKNDKDYNQIVKLLKDGTISFFDDGIKFGLYEPWYLIATQDDDTVASLEELVYIYKTCDDLEIKSKIMAYILGAKNG